MGGDGGVQKMKENQHKSVEGREREKEREMGKISGKKERRGKGGKLDITEQEEESEESTAQPVSGGTAGKEVKTTKKIITFTPWPTSSSTL